MMDKVHSLASSEERKAIISDVVTRIGATTCKALNLADSHKAFLISKYFSILHALLYSQSLLLGFYL